VNYEEDGTYYYSSTNVAHVFSSKPDFEKIFENFSVSETQEELKANGDIKKDDEENLPGPQYINLHTKTHKLSPVEFIKQHVPE